MSSFVLPCGNEECGAPVEVSYTVEGSYIRASHDSPAEYPEIVIDDVKCVKCGTLIRQHYTDRQLDEHASDDQSGRYQHAREVHADWRRAS